ncbi:MAG: HPr(Ser) kinase/phosphatase [Calditrichales bacterium]|nr:MAG: HPr(Ser) kinase/phosphatase [Calditrichales bacterium]
MESSFEHITVSTFFKDNKDRLKLTTMSSENGFNRKITKGDTHRPGLALAGFVDLFTYDRVQVLGNTEIRYLSSLSKPSLIESIDRFIEFEIPCIIVSNGNKVPEYFIQAARRRSISIFCTPLTTTTLNHLMGDYLDMKFAPRVSVHGSLVDVYGVGMMVTGRSGIGKSEVALDLVERGHRLVADDVVIITRTAEDTLIGIGREISEHHLELRGVGLVDVKKIFGIRSVRIQKRIEVEIRLHDWDSTKDWERTGLDGITTKVLDVELPLINLPINPGKNMTVICETIAMNELLKIQGYHTAKEFNMRLKQHMKSKTIGRAAPGDIPLRRDKE